jgi:DNA-binding response OmpR family regulator
MWTRSDPPNAQMEQVLKKQLGGFGDRPAGAKDPLWIFMDGTDHHLARVVADALRRDGHRVVDGAQGIALLLNLVSLGLSPVAPEVAVVVVCDIGMPLPEGLAVLRRLGEQGDYCPPFIPITDFSAEDIQKEARYLGALTILTKPLALNHLQGLVEQRRARFGVGR